MRIIRAEPYLAVADDDMASGVVAHLVELEDGTGTIIRHLDLDDGGFKDPIVSIEGNKLVRSWKMFAHGLVTEEDIKAELEPDFVERIFGKPSAQVTGKMTG